MIQHKGLTGFRSACDCTPLGVDLLTVDGARGMAGWHGHALRGHSLTCDRCGDCWALVGALDRRGLIGLRQVPPVEAPDAWALGEGPVRLTEWRRRRVASAPLVAEAA